MNGFKIDGSAVQINIYIMEKVKYQIKLRLFFPVVF